MSNHPYPYKIIEAVAKSMHETNEHYSGTPIGVGWDEIGGIDKDLLEEAADRALQALWDANRVDTLDEVGDLPIGSAVVDKDNWVWKQFDAEHDLHEDDLPAHVIYWGDRDA